MLQSLSAAIPEIWLLASAIILLMVGVFLKKHSFPIVYWLSFFVLVIGIIGQIIWFPDATVTLFNGMFISKPALTILKIVCWMAAAACLLMSPSYIRTMPNLSRFEFPILILFAVLGMSLMLSANHLITLYVSIELQSLALYVLAAFNRDHLRSSEAGLKYFALGALSSGLLLYGCSLLYGFSGNAGFAEPQMSRILRLCQLDLWSLWYLWLAAFCLKYQLFLSICGHRMFIKVRQHQSLPFLQPPLNWLR